MMTKRKEFDLGLEQLNELIVEMGNRVEKSIGEAMIALINVDGPEAVRIIVQDKELNQIEERISELGATLIATQQPVAKDLRRILVAFKIASDLERMGDFSVDIAKVVVRLEGQTLIKPLIDLPRMTEIVQLMTRESIQSYVQENVDLAYKMAKDDDMVDALYSQIIRELFTIMMENPLTISQANLLSFVGRYLERFADHATNIGESVVYLVTGARPDLNS
ncbi:phosphate transport system regulatory protein PhoU [Paenibacillus baekrokdamisoli]|uniref:Phosphate-specific transport system accessory protein PhoU n=2 Tax=Paenibacillus baekrokdamisoli TaxID=1712516 RepID=A0A3G9IIX9_9BACL|nr:phosphate transport system protein [Paenibacillus baekrokdamisoli]BBH18957.1 phosphate transport system regulatory protein PhoU [Paenibacillus baekrokdamisoli]